MKKIIDGQCPSGKHGWQLSIPMAKSTMKSKYFQWTADYLRFLACHRTEIYLVALRGKTINYEDKTDEWQGKKTDADSRLPIGCPKHSTT